MHMMWPSASRARVQRAECTERLLQLSPLMHRHFNVYAVLRLEAGHASQHAAPDEPALSIRSFLPYRRLAVIQLERQRR